MSSQLFFRDYAGKTWYNEGTKGANSNQKSLNRRGEIRPLSKKRALIKDANSQKAIISPIRRSCFQAATNGVKDPYDKERHLVFKDTYSNHLNRNTLVERHARH